MSQKKFVFILTHSYDDPDKVAGALQLATNMKAFDVELDSKDDLPYLAIFQP